MISLSAAVTIILYLLACGLVFGLLYYLILYCEREFPGMPLFFKVARIALVFLAVLVIIGVLVHVAGGTPIFRD